MGSCCSPGFELFTPSPLFPIIHRPKVAYSLTDILYYELETPSFQPCGPDDFSQPCTPTFPSVLDTTATSNPEADLTVN